MPPFPRGRPDVKAYLLILRMDKSAKSGKKRKISDSAHSTKAKKPKIVDSLMTPSRKHGHGSSTPVPVQSHSASVHRSISSSTTRQFPSKNSALTSSKKISKAHSISKKKPPLPVLREEEILSGAVSEKSKTDKQSVKIKRPTQRNLLKPTHGSWMGHAGGIVLYRCVQCALMKSQDYREDVKHTNWARVKSEMTLTADDLEMVWFFLKKEFEGKSLEEIEWALKPYANLTTGHFAREETRLKYKDKMPKPPVSAYLLYSNTVQQRFKEKYPNLNQKEIAKKIGQKWHTLPPEKHQKYRDEYTTRRKEYTNKMRDFLEEHPDAKTVRVRRRDERAIPPDVDPQKNMMKEMVRSLCPKRPPTAFTLFCRAKRPSILKKHPNLSAKEVSARLSERWKSRDEKAKAKYQKRYIDSNCVYQQELKKFHDAYPEAKELLASSIPKRTRTIKVASEYSDWSDSSCSEIEDQQKSEERNSSLSEEEKEEEEVKISDSENEEEGTKEEPKVVVPLSLAQKPLKALGKKTAAASSRQPTLSTKGGAFSSSLTIRKELEHNGKESSDYDSDSESDSNSVISDI